MGEIKCPVCGSEMNNTGGVFYTCRECPFGCGVIDLPRIAAAMERQARYNALMDTANRNAAQGDRIRQELKEHTKCQTAENYLLADCMCLEYHECVAALSRVARLEEALPDPDKLEILARWLDLNFGDDRNSEVQTDLREWAKKIRNVLGEK